MIAASTAFIRRSGESIIALPGWRRYLLALLLGVTAAGALPPVYMVPLLVPAFVGLVWLIDGSRDWRRAALAGWWFGLGHFVFGTYWISVALLTDAERFGWMIPFAVLGLSGLQALFPAAAAALTKASRASGLGRIFAFGASWTLVEWLRGMMFTGFPWNLIGTVWSFSDEMIQIASLTGVLGLGLITVTIAAIPAALTDPADEGNPGVRPRRWPVLLGALAALAAVWLFGNLRLASVADAHVAGVTLRIVQPNVPQDQKWRSEVREANFRRQLQLSVGPGHEKVTHVIWPETAAPFFLEREPERRFAIAAVAPRGGLVITGAPRTTANPEQPIRVWNSLQAIDRAGVIIDTYDKHHLVPFGEYLPFRWLLAPLGLDKLAPGDVDFSAGPGPRTLTLPGLPRVSPLICYEVIFSGAVVADGARPGWLLNVTNDAWFGRSSGPYQHFASARMRAVEEGLPLVRAANTGISAVLDAYGRTNAMLDLGEEGVIDAPLPSPTPELTIYARFGVGIPAILVFLTGVLGGLTSHRP